MKHIKIGEMQKAEEEYEKQQKQEKQHRREMFASFKKHGQCPDYKSGECDSKGGVYVCWDSDKHRKYSCPIIDYSE